MAGSTFLQIYPRAGCWRASSATQFSVELTIVCTRPIARDNCSFTMMSHHHVVDHYFSATTTNNDQHHRHHHRYHQRGLLFLLVVFSPRVTNSVSLFTVKHHHRNTIMTVGCIPFVFGSLRVATIQHHSITVKICWDAAAPNCLFQSASVALGRPASLAKRWACLAVRATTCGGGRGDWTRRKLMSSQTQKPSGHPTVPRNNLGEHTTVTATRVRPSCSTQTCSAPGATCRGAN